MEPTREKTEGAPDGGRAAGWLIPVVALLLLAAVPVSIRAGFRHRVARERKAALAAFAGIPATPVPARIPRTDELARKFRADETFPFGTQFSNHFEPPTEGELAAIRAWREGNPAAVSLFDHIAASPSNAPSKGPLPANRGGLWTQDMWTQYVIPFFERGFLEEAAARGDRAAAEDCDRRLRNLDGRATDLTLLNHSENLRLGTFSQTLPLFSDDYLDELDREARDRLDRLGAEVASILALDLILHERYDSRNEGSNPGGPSGTKGRFFERFSERIGDEMARANMYRFYANAPAVLARLDDIRLHHRPMMEELLDDVDSSFVSGMVREWPSFHPLFKATTDQASFFRSVVHQMVFRRHNALCFERTAIAIERFRRRTGRLPERLDDLPDVLPGCLPTGRPPVYRAGTFHVAGFRRPATEEEFSRRAKASVEETDQAFLDPDFERPPPPAFRVRGYVLSVRSRFPAWSGPHLGHVFDEDDNDCAGCFLWGSVVPDDDSEPVVYRSFGPAGPEPLPPGEM